MMLWFRKKKREAAENLEYAQAANADVVNAKRHTTKKINEVDKSNARLKSLLESNGITLRIHIATRGGHNHVR